MRRVEHAIQALNDQQTQLLPEETDLRKRIIDTLGFTSWNEFIDVLNEKRQKVKFSLSSSLKTQVPMQLPRTLDS